MSAISQSTSNGEAMSYESPDKQTEETIPSDSIPPDTPNRKIKQSPDKQTEETIPSDSIPPDTPNRKIKQSPDKQTEETIPSDYIPPDTLNRKIKQSPDKQTEETIPSDSIPPDTPNRKNQTVTNSQEKVEMSQQEFNSSIKNNSNNISSSSIENPIPQEKRTYFQVGVSEDRNKRCRRTMEDAHSYKYDFAGIEGQGFFAIFDGHAGKQAAEWCGENFHETFHQVLLQNPTLPIPEIFNLAFLEADKQLKNNAGKHSGCTAIAAFLRTEEIEEINGKENVQNGTAESTKSSKRVLYTANVGDARAVLCRNDEAIRLSYDHKGSDAQEAKRIVEAGGFVMNNRVNGVLAVTRSLGDSSMKEFVVGSPYTTETILTEKDPFLILACDGLWDVCEDQEAVDLIKDITDPQLASKELLEHALQNYSTDNLSVMVVRLINRLHEN